MEKPASKNSILENLNETYFKMDELFHALDNSKPIDPKLAELIYYCSCALSFNLDYMLEKLNEDS